MSELLQRAPSVHRALFVDGVPESFIGRRYKIAPSVTLFRQRKDELIVQFGTSGLSNPIGTDLATGHVVKIMNAQGFPAVFVNASIEKFTETVRVMINRFPYYGEREIEDKAQAVSEELLRIIRNIDPEAALPDRYWSMFVDDMAIGDLSTEAVSALD